MRKLTDTLYWHRGEFIMVFDYGVEAGTWEEVFASVNSAKEFINKVMDGTNKSEPKIIGKTVYKEGQGLVFIPNDKN
jgi:hypothetical protein